MEPPFSKSRLCKIQSERQNWHRQLNLFGAGLLALNLPSFQSLYRGEATIIDFIVLLLSAYVALRALEFPATISSIFADGTEDQKKWMRDFMSKKTFLRKTLFYELGWISFILLFIWFTVFLIRK